VTDRLKTMEEEILRKINDQNKKIDAIWISVEKTRKYFLTTLIISVIMTVLPLIGLLIVIPIVLSSLSKSMEGLL
jgi:type IV secretory pathway component VirB8